MLPGLLLFCHVNWIGLCWTEWKEISRIVFRLNFFEIGRLFRLLAYQMGIVQRLLCITFMTSQSHLRRSCCIVMSHGPWLLRRCFKRGLGDHRKQPIDEFNWIVISVEIQLIKTAHQMAKIITLSVCKKFQTTIFIQIKSREINWWRHFPIRSSSWLSILPHKYGGQITESLHCEMDSLHVISKQPTLLAGCRQHALRACYDLQWSEQVEDCWVMDASPCSCLGTAHCKATCVVLRSVG